MIHRIQLAPIVLALGLVSGSAHAALQGRDLNGSLGSFEAYYDTDRNITWLADANYAKTSGYDADGKMTWADATTWAANLSLVDAVNNLTYDNWRLPTVPGTHGCNGGYTGTNCGYNVDTVSSEMAHLFHDELGNKSYYDTSGNPQSGWGLTNTGPFTNFQAPQGNVNPYWSDTEYSYLSADDAWYFDFLYGYQAAVYKPNSFYALAVSPGDVGLVPEADTWVMLLAGLGLVGAATRRRCVPCWA